MSFDYGVGSELVFSCLPTRKLLQPRKVCIDCCILLILLCLVFSLSVITLVCVVLSCDLIGGTVFFFSQRLFLASSLESA